MGDAADDAELQAFREEAELLDGEEEDDEEFAEVAVERAVAVSHPTDRMLAAVANSYEGKYQLRTIMTIGSLLARSGYFQDAAQEAQAIAKCLAGAELGISPIAAMTNIYIVRGRVMIGAQILAALVKNSKKYRYHIKTLTNDACEIIFFEGKEQLGVSTFTLQDAQTAGLIKDKKGEAWAGHRRNMLFARALSNGVRWYCPDLTMFSVYTPGEMDENDVIEMPAAVPAGPRPVDEGEIERLNNSAPVEIE